MKQIQKKRLTENKVEGKQKGRELDVSREHTLTEAWLPELLLGSVWLIQGWVLHAGAE